MISELVTAAELTCPACRGPLPDGSGLRNAPLEWSEVHEERSGRPHHGLLACPACGSRYPLVDGIAVVLSDTASWLRGQAQQVHARDDLPGELSRFLTEAWEEDGRAAWHRQMRAVYSRGRLLADGRADAWMAPLLERGRTALQARREALVAHVGAGETVLDAGCGIGDSTLELAALGARVVAFDHDFAALRQLSRLLDAGVVEVPYWGHGGADFSTRPLRLREPGLADRIALVAGDVLDPPFAAASFAGITALNLLDNVAEPVTAVRQLHGVLQPGGRLLLASPFDWSSRATPRAARLGDGVRHPAHGADPAATLHALLRGELPEHAPELDLQVGHSEELPWVLVRHDRSAHMFVSHLVEADKRVPASEGG